MPDYMDTEVKRVLKELRKVNVVDEYLLREVRRLSAKLLLKYELDEFIQRSSSDTWKYLDYEKFRASRESLIKEINEGMDNLVEQYGHVLLRHLLAKTLEEAIRDDEDEG